MRELLLPQLVVLLLLAVLLVRMRMQGLRQKEAQLEASLQKKVQELEEHVKTLKSYQQELLRKDMRKSRFIRIISHDLIGPLHSIRLMSEQVRRRPETMDRENLLSTMNEVYSTTEGLLRLCNELLTWIGTEQGRYQVTSHPFNLHELVQEKIELFRQQAQQKNIQLVNRCPQGLEVCNDSNAMNVLLHNLISNALKFTSNGSVEVSAGRSGRRTFISVRDTGTGMSNSRVRELLNNNMIASQPDTDNNYGHGLGILIIRELVAATGGTMLIQSTPGAGTTITLRWHETLGQPLPAKSATPFG